MQSVIDADEKLQTQILNNQLIHDIIEENEEEERSISKSIDAEGNQPKRQ